MTIISQVHQQALELWDDALLTLHPSVDENHPNGVQLDADLLILPHVSNVESKI